MIICSIITKQPTAFLRGEEWKEILFISLTNWCKTSELGADGSQKVKKQANDALSNSRAQKAPSPNKLTTETKQSYTEITFLSN